jgi:hypothetical protein
MLLCKVLYIVLLLVAGAPGPRPKPVTLSTARKGPDYYHYHWDIVAYEATLLGVYCTVYDLKVSRKHVRHSPNIPTYCMSECVTVYSPLANLTDDLFSIPNDNCLLASHMYADKAIYCIYLPYSYHISYSYIYNIL